MSHSTTNHILSIPTPDVGRTGSTHDSGQLECLSGLSYAGRGRGPGQAVTFALRGRTERRDTPTLPGMLRSGLTFAAVPRGLMRAIRNNQPDHLFFRIPFVRFKFNPIKALTFLILRAVLYSEYRYKSLYKYGNLINLMFKL